MEQAIQHGADIIIRDWVRLRAGERILIVSSQKYAVEVAAMQQAAQAVGSVADVLMLDDLHEQVGQYFDDREDAFDPYNAVIGAAEYSLITTRAVKRVIARRNRFLSLPLSTSNGQSLLSYDFLNMSLPKSRIMASIIMACYQNASHIHVTTELGTNLDFNIEGRVPGFFNGCCHDGKGLSSASVEVYVAPVESDTNGTLILDGSMGYIGIVDSPVRVELRGGRIVEIEDNASGRRLKQVSGPLPRPGKHGGGGGVRHRAQHPLPLCRQLLHRGRIHLWHLPHRVRAQHRAGRCAGCFRPLRSGHPRSLHLCGQPHDHGSRTAHRSGAVHLYLRIEAFYYEDSAHWFRPLWRRDRQPRF